MNLSCNGLDTWNVMRKTRTPSIRFGFAGPLVAILLAMTLSVVTLDNPLPVSAQTGTPSTDRAALVALYNATSGHNWTDRENWLSNRPIGEWYGVTTNNQGRVAFLSLSRNNLTGSIPPELGSLLRLSNLDLSFNQLTGRMPAELGNLSDLVHLQLGYNGLTGGIPPELGSLSDLRTLWIARNELTGSIPAELGNLLGLETAHLGGNELTGPIPAGLGNLSNVEILILAGNELNGPIPKDLGNLPKLRELFLYNNQLTGTIPEELGNLSDLELLYIQSNKLTGPLPHSLTNLAALENIAFGDNAGLCAPTDETFQSWLQGIPNTGYPPWSTIPSVGPNCGEQATPTPPTSHAGDRAALVALYNSTGGANWTDSTNWLSDRPLDEWQGVSTDDAGRVTEINLQENNLTGQIPFEVGNLSSLIILDMDSNRLSGSMPSALGNLANLQKFDLSDNELDGPVPSQMGNLANLRILNLHTNQVSGEIPSELGRLSNLEELLLLENQLTGEIPSELGNLSNLTTLYLWSNDLSGEIPAELGNLSNLRELWLDANQLSGPIPSELGNLSNLTELTLWRNQLTGEIPSALSNLSKLTNLELGRNQLTGEIPAELGKLTNLEKFSVSGNQITGEIPAVLGGLSKLRHLYLRETQLSGEIPVELGNLSDLEHLALSHNDLTGGVPTELGNLTKLELLYLYGNQLTDPLPDSLTKLIALERFAFGDNDGLCAPTNDAFQTWLQGVANEDLPDDATSVGPNCGDDATPTSPSNGLIAFQTNRDGNDEIYVMNADGSDEANLTSNIANEDLPSWSPDGQRIVFASNRDGNREIYAMNTDGSSVTRLTSHPAYDSFPSWSPDGQQIAFVSDRDGNDEIYLMNVDGSSVTRLTNHPARDLSPSWSPDGQSIAFQSGRDGVEEIYVMNADGSGKVNLTNSPAADFDPDWSPAGQRIAFNSDRDRNYEIYVMNADGSDVTRLTNHPIDDFAPSWSPDGQHIAFYTNRDGNYEIYAVDRDGSGVTRLTDHPEDDEYPSWSPTTGNIVPEPTPTPTNDRAALVALYNTTNGANWNNNTNWLTDRPLGEWHGITTGDNGRVVRIRFGCWVGHPENNLSGTIPRELGNLSDLQELSLCDNPSLTGVVPAELGNLSNLRRLDFDENQLTGAIPHELGNLTNLRSLDFYGNRLSGTLPQSLTNLVDLHFFQFGDNDGLCAPADTAFQQWLQGVGPEGLNGPNCEEPASQPFKLEVLDVPEHAEVGQPFEITVKMHGVQQEVPHGGISVSFPDLTEDGGGEDGYSSDLADVEWVQVAIDDAGVVSGVKFFQPGEGQIYPADGDDSDDSVDAEYLLVESDDPNWSQNDVRTLTLRITPKQEGQFEILVRGWICASVDEDGRYDDCTHLPEIGDAIDQQGWPAEELVVNVTAREGWLELAQKYAPVLRMHPDEIYFPKGVEALVENAVLTYHDPDLQIKPVVVATNLTRDMLAPDMLTSFKESLPEELSSQYDGANWYLDIPGPDYSDPVLGTEYPSPPTRNDGTDYPIKVYATIRDHIPDKVYLQYYLFYFYDHVKPDFSLTACEASGFPLCQPHEADWELIQLEFDAADVADALKMMPKRLAFSQHGWSEDSSYDDVSKIEDHPIAYIAQGKHANYYGPDPDITTAGTADDPWSLSISRDQVSDRGKALFPPDFPSKYEDPCRSGESENAHACTYSYELELIHEGTPWVAYQGKWGGSEISGPDHPYRWDTPHDWMTNTNHPPVGGIEWSEGILANLNLEEKKGGQRDSAILNAAFYHWFYPRPVPNLFLPLPEWSRALQPADPHARVTEFEYSNREYLLEPYFFNTHYPRTIPPSLGDLSDLQSLDVQGNGFTGTIPVQLGYLSKLRKLYLNDNNLTGEIPPLLGDLRQLETFHLAGNDLTGCIPNELKTVADNDFDETDLEFCDGTSPSESPLPEFRLDSRTSDRSVEVGESFTLSVEMHLTEGEGEQGGISVSFPQLSYDGGGEHSHSSWIADVERVQAQQAGSEDVSGVKFYQPGEGRIHRASDNKEIRARRLLVESDESWQQDDERVMTLRITPKQEVSSSIILVRGWVCA